MTLHPMRGLSMLPWSLPALLAAEVSIDPAAIENRILLIGVVLIMIAERAWTAYHSARKQSMADYAASDRGRAEKAEAAMAQAEKSIAAIKQAYEAAIKEERCHCDEKQAQLRESTEARLAYKLAEITTLRDAMKRKDDLIHSQEEIIKDLAVQSQALSDAMARQTEELSQLKTLTLHNSKQLRRARQDIAAASGSSSNQAIPVATFKVDEAHVEAHQVDVKPATPADQPAHEQDPRP